MTKLQHIRVLVILPVTSLLSVVHTAVCFVPNNEAQYQISVRQSLAASSTTDTSAETSEWTALADDGAVKKLTISPGNGSRAQDGDEVAIEYVGTLARRSWSAQDVVDCWLSEQQGLQSLSPMFIELDVDGTKLLDNTYFTEAFVADELGVENKLQCKKLVMAAKRLGKEIADHPEGKEFDSSRERGAYKFTLGKGKAIKAMELAVASMVGGERARIVARSDYCYGKDGLRRSNGDVMVPPFATLEFVITLLEI